LEHSISAEKLSSIISLIYDCAMDPSRWSTAIDAIRIELNFENAVLDLMELPSGRLISDVACNIPPQYLSMIAGAGPDVIEQWGGADRILTLSMAEPAVLRQVNPEFDPETSRNSYYLSFGKPQGIIDVMAIGLARDARGQGSIAFGRHFSAGLIGEREITVARLLIPHLQRAATITRLIDGLSTAQSAFSTTLDTLSVPILMISAACHVIHANAAARQLLDANHLVRLNGGLLEAMTPLASAALRSAVRAAGSRTEDQHPRRAIPVLMRDGNVGALHVLPLTDHNRGDGDGDGDGVVAAVLVADIGAAFVAPTEVAATLFNFTATEARVFQHIVSGQTQAETAEAMGVGRATVKSHLMRIYDKVGVHRQAGLVQVAASLALPVADPKGLQTQ